MATRHAAGRSLFAGVAVGALVAAAAVAVAALAGFGPGWWLLAAVLPAVVVALLRLRRVRPSFDQAALLLDRAAGTRERFVTCISASDEEARDLIARQALDRVPGRRLPIVFPPSAEGLAAVASLVLLTGLLFLLPDPSAGTPDEITDVPRASVPGDPGARDPQKPDRADPSAIADEPRGVVARLRRGEEPTDGDWEALEIAGMSQSERDALKAALAKGDGESAAKAAAGVLARGDESAGSTTAARAAAWRRYEATLETPGWHPRFDRIVREYFREAGQRGLR